MKLTDVERRALLRAHREVRRASEDAIWAMHRTDISADEHAATMRRAVTADMRFADLVDGDRTPEDVLAEIERERKERTP